MKDALQQLITQAIQSLINNGSLMVDMPTIKIDRTRDKSHGDFAANVAMLLAKPARKNPREIASMIIDSLPASEFVEKIEIAGPGFINFYVSNDSRQNVVNNVIEQGDAFGRSTKGAGKTVQVEFVSANPTGPLHVGHGRGAAYGATLANLLDAIGYTVHCEYYVNDAGRQMDILATSVWLRYLEKNNVAIVFPANAYKGDYIHNIVDEIYNEHGDAYIASAEDVMADLPLDEPDGGDKELHIDALIEKAKKLLGDNRYRFVFELALNSILDDIRDDLADFGVNYDEWFSERSLMDKGLVNQGIERLRERGRVYEEKGALWFRSTDFGDDKDRVIQRDNGQTTYFASDIAYHMDKFDRGYELVIDVWGADHHGYVPRVKAALTALDHNADALDVLLVQFANLYRGGEKVPMSTRSGSFVTLRELRDEVGSDAARFFYVMRKCEQHLDFDLELAKTKSSENPVYYIQYAHARICSIFRQLAEKNLTYDQEMGLENLAVLAETHESDILQQLAKYPEVVDAAASQHEPHLIAHYLRELANTLHTYYNAHQFIVDDEKVRNARLVLITATRQIIKNGLALLGVSSPSEM
ncbi:MAG: arginine--tRNA ligase [gamma proteobacterium symbiont of Bathyaustriella thionipta]|nr:arginine--tRNA ligase [gamma proteobacterium symbiont of Bathyaustriella thionipta]MCU7950386.1 arginine--tRNA ligase [gamma proteobacterium symbiont of Bathyaustriella thionipta]MCU7953503.1 arginine--tRNA ligase [gamma proteobacterium symbiont of Bathyaustriella thionipta]MCU7956900.1 arginine--tRNA ligase [gamma proteobacterium symbiont of Bathyaustriella thionipta]MCU7966782.1 arginine--tRNA ligase [gamma proteobacterium symbiont of Bathyaustriella thionipta]